MLKRLAKINDVCWKFDVFVIEGVHSAVVEITKVAFCGKIITQF